jgi:hypothetical protein
MVMAASIIGAGFPVVAKKVSWIKVPKKTFFLCKHFGTGVLVATAFVHVNIAITATKKTVRHADRITAAADSLRQPH